MEKFYFFNIFVVYCISYWKITAVSSWKPLIFEESEEKRIITFVFGLQYFRGKFDIILISPWSSVPHIQRKLLTSSCRGKTEKIFQEMVKATILSLLIKMFFEIVTFYTKNCKLSKYFKLRNAGWNFWTKRKIRTKLSICLFFEFDLQWRKARFNS